MTWRNSSRSIAAYGRLTADAGDPTPNGYPRAAPTSARPDPRDTHRRCGCRGYARSRGVVAAMNMRRELARAASRKTTVRRTRELSPDELREEVRRLRAELRSLEKDKRKVERDLERLNAVLARQVER